MKPHEQPTKHEGAYEIGVRDQIEATYMKGITPEIERKLMQMKDSQFCEILEAVQQCRLAIASSKKRVREKRAAIAIRRENRALAKRDPLYCKGRPKTARRKACQP